MHIHLSNSIDGGSCRLISVGRVVLTLPKKNTRLILDELLVNSHSKYLSRKGVSLVSHWVDTVRQLGISCDLLPLKA